MGTGFDAGFRPMLWSCEARVCFYANRGGSCWVMNDRESEDSVPPPGNRKTNRIETQIHRRRKVSVFSPLESEWETVKLAPQDKPSMAPALEQLPERPQHPPTVVDCSVPDEVAPKSETR